MGNSIRTKKNQNPGLLPRKAGFKK